VRLSGLLPDLEHHPHGPLTDLIRVLLRRWHDSHLRKVASLQRTRGGSLTVSRISRLRISDLHANGAVTELLLGRHRLRLAPALAQLLRRCATADDEWLFRGGHPGSHAVAGLHRKLKRHGLPDADRCRATALISLTADLPAPILADLLGIRINTATAWANHAQADWAAYLAARTAATERIGAAGSPTS
jgi:hypothetical protein